MEKTKGKKREVVWRAAEHEYREKDVSWYWVVGTIATVFILIAVWQRNFFFLIFLLIATPMMFFFGKRKPRVLTLSVNDEGVGLGKGMFYEYGGLEGYHVLENEDVLDQIVFKKKGTFNPFFRVLVDSETRARAEEILRDHLNTIDYEPTFLDIMSEWMGF
ncbi:MAG: hypothetical protein Q8R20_02560 [Nanoarchaeota archaeon]|nr:hypothetical protein [Nanoarchaeota archaeon]